jgi:hypothetical protein
MRRATLPTPRRSSSPCPRRAFSSHLHRRARLRARRLLPLGAPQPVVGRLCALPALVPFGWWRRMHAVHHATSGKLHRRHTDIETLTVGEYRALSRGGRLRYRLIRHPLVLFGLAPALYFGLAMRLPWIAPAAWRRERRSILLTDVALALVIAALVRAVGGAPSSRSSCPCRCSPRRGDVALLRAAPVRGHLLGRRRAWDPTRARAGRRVAPRAAARARLVHGLHRAAPRAPSQPARPELPPRGVRGRRAGAARRAAPHPRCGARQLAACAVGRGGAAAGWASRRGRCPARPRADEAGASADRRSRPPALRAARGRRRRRGRPRQAPMAGRARAGDRGVPPCSPSGHERTIGAPRPEPSTGRPASARPQAALRPTPARACAASAYSLRAFRPVHAAGGARRYAGSSLAIRRGALGVLALLGCAGSAPRARTARRPDAPRERPAEGATDGVVRRWMDEHHLPGGRPRRGARRTRRARARLRRRRPRAAHTRAAGDAVPDPVGDQVVHRRRRDDARRGGAAHARRARGAPPPGAARACAR